MVRGKYAVSAEVAEKPAYKRDFTFETSPLRASDLLEIIFFTIVKRADGATDVNVSVVLKELGYAIRNLKFSTTEGTILNSLDKSATSLEVGPIGTSNRKGAEVGEVGYRSEKFVRQPLSS